MLVTLATGAVLMVALGVVCAAVVAKRLPRQMKARLGQELVSPVVLAVSGDWISPGEGPPWNVSWEPHADAMALQRAVSSASPGRAVVVGSLENQPIRRSRLAFAYQNLNDPRLAELCAQLSLGEITRQVFGDMELFRRLTSHVRGLAEHTEQHASTQMSYGASPDALSILAGVRNGQTLQCHAYTLLLIQCLAALGYTARQSSCGYFGPREHVVVEVWSAEYRKWLMLDPDYDLLYVRGGLPLSVYEVQQVALGLERGFREWVFANNLHIADRGERDRMLARYAERNKDVLDGVQAIRGTATSPRISQKMAESPTGICLEVHRSFAVSLRNDYLSRSYPVCHPRRFAQAAMAAGAARWMADYDGVLTDDLADLYWTLNSVRMAFEPAAEAGTILVRLGTFTPSFKSFRVVLDGQAIDTTEPLLRWRLGDREHSISACAVNARGLEGAPSTARFTLS